MPVNHANASTSFDRQTRALTVWSFATTCHATPRQENTFLVFSQITPNATPHHKRIQYLNYYATPKIYISIFKRITPNTTPTPYLCNNLYYIHKCKTNPENLYYKIFWTYTSHTAYFNPTRPITCMLIPGWSRISNNIKTHPKINH